MAKEKSAWERYDEREREREEEESKQSTVKQKSYVSTPTRDLTPNQLKEVAKEAKIDELFARAEPLIEQLNNLYGQYIAGVEKAPPTERRKQLDQTMQTLVLMGKPTKSLQFRASELINKYNSYKDRWDRMLKDLESGKLKRGRR